MLWIGDNGFNPHTHEGCDIAAFSSYPSIKVSIHTPTKGVTPPEALVLPATDVSIHTPTKGVTSDDPADYIRFVVSIHTPTKGVTAVRQKIALFLAFQSTHPRRV